MRNIIGLVVGLYLTVALVVFAAAGLGCLAGRRLEQGRGRPVDADEALVVGVTGRDQGRVPDGHRDGDRTQG